MTNPDLSRSDHQEAVRLMLKSLHIPVGTILVGLLLLTGVASATATVWGYGAANPMP